MEYGNKSQIASIMQRFEASITTALPAFLFNVIALWAMNSIFPLDMYLVNYGLTLRQSDMLTCILPICLTLLWIVFDGGISRATYGMRNRKIRYGTTHGLPISMRRCILRIVVGIITIPLFPVSTVMAIRDKHKQTIADRICKTIVWINDTKEEKGRVDMGRVSAHVKS